MARVRAGSIEQALASALFAALRRPMPADGTASAIDAPSPDLLLSALENARTCDADLAALADAFAALEPRLPWIRGRTLGPGEPVDLHAVIVGPNGLEPRDDAEIGVSLMDPGSVYIDHDHPPDEVYLVLSP